MDLLGDVIRIIAEYKDLPVEQVTPERTFEELDIDSLDAIDIIYEIEDQFSIEVPQDALDLTEAKRVQDVLDLVTKLAGDQPGAQTGD